MFRPTHLHFSDVIDAICLSVVQVIDRLEPKASYVRANLKGAREANGPIFKYNINY
jgi:hypothetical protein